MDSWNCSSVNQIIIVILGLISLVLVPPPPVLGCFTSIFNFGDSLSDTGNLFNTCSDQPSPSCFSPYGDTFFHHPTGRFSDGRLILDFIAESLGLPLLQPYLRDTNNTISIEEFGKGLNFAVSGATALDASFLREKGVVLVPTNYSLGVQLEWFKNTYLSLCPPSSSIATAKCREILKSSLVLVGEIGGNDYNYPFFERHSFEDIKSFVPLVIKAIASTIKELIELGVETIMVPGNIPIGCNPLYRMIYGNSVQNSEDGCLNWLNQFSEYHNKQLQEELNRIRARHPHVHIVYADYYNAAMRFYKAPEEFGLTNTMQICMGLEYTTFNDRHTKHGVPSFTKCNDPSKYVNWDGLHLTEAAYKLIAINLLQGPYTSPQIKTLCISQNGTTNFLQLQ